MTLTRRKTLALIGGGTLLAATGATATFLATRTPTRAIAPWDLAGSYADPRLNALSWGLLAPNPHNRQPWQAQLLGEDALLLWRDKTLDLPHTDPFSRQLVVGMGCFLELTVLAAAQTGHGAEVTLYPEGEDGPVAHVRLLPGVGRADPLFAHTLARRSCKEPFDSRPVPANLVAQLEAFADIHTDPATVAVLRDLTTRAWDIEMQTPRTWKESVDLLRIGKAEINASPDGIDLGGAFFDVAKPLGLVNRADMLDLDHMGSRQTRDVYHEIMASTQAHVALRSPGNTRADQIEAGRRWLRLNLATTSLGLSLHPVSQALQEYPEMAGPYAEVHALLAAPGETVQMLGRLGYGPDIPRTPRWALDEKLKRTGNA